MVQFFRIYFDQNRVKLIHSKSLSDEKMKLKNYEVDVFRKNSDNSTWNVHASFPK